MLCYILFEEVVISLEFMDSKRKITCTNRDNINYIGCDYETCYFACVKGVSFSNIVVRRLRWSCISFFL
jgi:hypothetical protein